MMDNGVRFFRTHIGHTFTVMEKTNEKNICVSSIS